jgi:hypothetical protein
LPERETTHAKTATWQANDAGKHAHESRGPDAAAIVRCSSRVGGAALAKKHDYAVSIGVTAIVLGLFVIGGITFTYMTRPALVEAAAKRVLDIRQMFEENFR